MKYMPKLDPKVDLVGATPETLTRALFRRVEPFTTGSRSKARCWRSGRGREGCAQ